MTCRTLRISEDDIHIQVVEWLRLVKPPCLWWHTPNSSSGTIPMRFAVKLQKLGQRAGVADLTFVWRELDMPVSEGPRNPEWYASRTGFIELKSATGKQSGPQEEFEREALNIGCDYRIARSLEDVQKIMKNWGLT